MIIKTKLLKKLHTVSSLICCTLLLIFSLSGLSLNHRALFEAIPTLKEQHITVAKLTPLALGDRLLQQQIELTPLQLSSLAEMQELSIATPGKRLEIYIEQDTLSIESADLGLWVKLNELHQNRHTSTLWLIVSDVSALLLIFSAASGIWLSLRDKKQRKNYLIYLSLSLISFILLLE